MHLCLTPTLSGNKSNHHHPSRIVSYGSWIYNLLPMQSVPITTNVVSSNRTLAKWTRYSVSSTKKSYHHDVTEILLKVALNTMHLSPNQSIKETVTSLLCSTNYFISDLNIDYTCTSAMIQENLLSLYRWHCITHAQVYEVLIHVGLYWKMNTFFFLWN